jgi:hypothetical protein
MFLPRWPSSSVQVVVVHDSAVHFNAVFFLLLLLPLVIIDYVGCTWLLLIFFGLLVVAALGVPVGAGVLLYAGPQ